MNSTHASRPRRTAAALAAGLVTAAGLASLTACASASGESNGKAVVRYQSYPGSVDVLELADALGKLPGVELKKVGDVQGGPASLQNLASRQVDISNSAFFGATAQVVASGAPIKSVVATYGTNGKTGSSVIALKGSGLTSDPHSFIGKKVSVNTLGANAEAVLDTWFTKGGLTRDQIKQVTLVPLPPLNSIQALKQHQVDAAYVDSGQLAGARKAAPIEVVLKDSDVAGFYNGGGFALRNDWIENKKALSRKLVSGISYAVDYIESHPRQQVLDIYDAWLKKHGYGASVEAVDQNWSGSTGVSSKGGVISDKDIAIWLDWLSSRGDVDPKKIKPSDVYTNEFNPSA